MRKAGIEIKTVIEKIKEMKGTTLRMEVNKGRKKIEKYIAVIENTYPSVFTVDIHEPENKGKQSFSYSDVLCGDVVFRKLKSDTKEVNVETEAQTG